MHFVCFLEKEGLSLVIVKNKKQFSNPFFTRFLHITVLEAVVLIQIACMAMIYLLFSMHTRHDVVGMLWGALVVPLIMFCVLCVFGVTSYQAGRCS